MRTVEKFIQPVFRVVGEQRLNIIIRQVWVVACDTVYAFILGLVRVKKEFPYPVMAVRIQGQKSELLAYGMA